METQHESGGKGQDVSLFPYFRREVLLAGACFCGALLAGAFFIWFIVEVVA